MRNKILTVILCATVALLAVSCAGGASSFEPSAEDKRVVMSVGGKDVQYQEFRYYLLNNRRDSFGEDELTKENIEELRELTENNARYTKAIEIMAEKYGAVLSGEDKSEVEAYIADYRATQCQNNDETYLLALEAQYMTDWLFRMLQENTVLAYNTIDKMLECGAISADDSTIDALLAGDELLCIKEIYIGYNTEQTKQYALKRAEKAFGELENGADFTQVMRDYSDYNQDAMSPEHGYYATEYEMPEYIWQAASELALGEYSVIIESAFGYHIVMRAEKDAAYMEDIREDISSRYVSAMYTKELYETIDTLEVEYTDYGKSLDIASLS